MRPSSMTAAQAEPCAFRLGNHRRARLGIPASALLLCLLLILRPLSARAWDQDVLVSAQAESVDVVTLVVDPCDPEHLFALLAKSHSRMPMLRSPDEIAVSFDGGAVWEPLCFPSVPPVRGGVDLALEEAALCLAELRSGATTCSLTVCLFDPGTGDLLDTRVVRDDLVAGGDVSLCSDQDVGQHGTMLFLAAVVDEGNGRQLFFTRSLDGGVTWQDEVVLTEGDVEWIDLAYVPGLGGRLHITYVLHGNLYVATNLNCGHSEYWGEVYLSLGPAEDDAHPSVAGRDSMILAAVEIPGGDIAYHFSPDGGMAWYYGGLLANTAQHEASPVLAADASGLFHVLYTDATACMINHRVSITPEDVCSWSVPQTVSDTSVWFGAEATHLEARPDPAGGVGALFVSCGRRTVGFDADGRGASGIGDRQRGRAGSGAPRGPFALRLAAPSPARPPVAIEVSCVIGDREQRLLSSVDADPEGASLGGELQLEILDATGRRINRLPLGQGHSIFAPSTAREIRLLWDGRDWQQRPVSPGIYLLRLRSCSAEAAGGSAVAARILIIR